MTKKPIGVCHGLLALTLSGCTIVTGGTGGGGEEALGSVRIAIQTVPSDIRCVQITAAGSRVQSKSFDVTPGTSSSLVMHGISPGSTKFTGASFPVTCANVVLDSVPTWVADAVTVTIVAGTQTNLTLVMRPAGVAGINVDFQGGASGGISLGIWDSTNWDNSVWQ